MKRFYFGNDEGGEEDEGNEFEMPPPTEFISMTQMESPARHLMDCSIKMCEGTFGWRFMSPDDKLAMVAKVFKGLAEIRKEYDENADL